MTVAQRVRGTSYRAAKRCGGGNTVTIRRDGKGLVSNTTGANLTTLAVNGTVAAGGTTISLDAASIEPGRMLGQGWRFTLVGHTAPFYEVQADKVVSSNNFASVAISPALTEEATNDAVATLTRQYGEWTFPAWRRSFEIGEKSEAWEGEAGRRFEEDDYVLVVHVTASSFTSFGKGDVVTWAGKRRSVVGRMPIQPGDDLAVMRLHCRG